MGQKVNPTVFRLGVETGYEKNPAEERRKSSAIWFAVKDYAKYLKYDLELRKYLENNYKTSGINRVDISRPSESNVNVTIYCARPGLIIGKKGADISVLRNKIAKISNATVQLNVEEIKKPDLNAKLVAESVALQLEKRAAFRRVLKRTVQTTMRAGAQGIKVNVSGRLGGAEIARSEDNRDGRVPLHTLRANIDYATARASTTYGIIGVKVWIYRGNINERKKG